ncbi:sialic acid-binding Ig-like lectin 13 [Pogona vitticeps]
MASYRRSAIWAKLMKLTMLTACFCKGIESNGIEGFTLTAPASLSVWQGRCLHIPCQFTYRSDSSSMNEDFSAYWLKNQEGAEYCFQGAISGGCVQGLLVATSDDAQRVERSAENRFYLTGNPNKGNCSFIITEAQLEDEGSYYFRIIGDKGLKFSYSTTYGYTSPHVSVTVSEGPQDVKIKVVIINSQTPGSSRKRDLGAKVALEGDTVRLLCTAKGRPSLTLTWKKDKESIGIPKQGNENAYEISSATSKDAGKYKCQAENDFGSATETIHLIVQYPPRFATFSISQIFERDPPLIQDFPRVTVSLVNGSHLVVQEGDSLQLLCKADGNPPATTVWINPMLEKLTDEILELVNLTSKDEGQYLCQTDNFLGSAQGMLTLFVESSGAPEMILPANVDIILLFQLGINKMSCCICVIILCNCWNLNWRKAPK